MRLWLAVIAGSSWATSRGDGRANRATIDANSASVLIPATKIAAPTESSSRKPGRKYAAANITRTRMPMGAVIQYVLPARTIRDWKMDRMADESIATLANVEYAKLTGGGE